MSKMKFLLKVLLTSIFVDLSWSLQGCGRTVTCFGSESGCLERSDCSIAVAFDKNFNFALVGKAVNVDDYIAVAISADSEMGSDLVIYCPNTPQGSPTVSYNIGKSNTNDVGGVTLDNKLVASKDGIFSCNFTISPKLWPSADGQSRISLDMISNNYYVFLASGSMSGTSLARHRSRYASPGPFNFTQTGFILEDSGVKPWYKAHGCLMCMAWLALAPVGMIFAQFYQGTWPGARACGKDLWFVIHQGFMLSTIGLTLISLAVMLSYEGIRPFQSEHTRDHAIEGIICIVLACVQPVMAFFRPHPDARYRYVFRWCHLIVGAVALKFALAAIFVATGFESLHLPKFLRFVLLAWVILYVVFHVFLLVHRCRDAKKLRQSASRSGAEDTGSFLKKILLLPYLLTLSALALTFVVVIGSA